MIRGGSGAKPSCCGSLLSITSHRAHPKGGATVPHRGERSERASAGARGVCGVAHAASSAPARRRDCVATARRRDGGTPWSGGPGGRREGSARAGAQRHGLHARGCVWCGGGVRAPLLPSSPPPPSPLSKVSLSLSKRIHTDTLDSRHRRRSTRALDTPRRLGRLPKTTRKCQNRLPMGLA